MRDDVSLIERFLDSRGLTKETYDEIDRPYDDKLMRIDDLVERLHGVHEAHDKIVILPDFDMDGIMSGVIGRAGLAELGFDVELFIPSTGGYGFDRDEVARLVQEHPGTKVVMTCDVGIAEVEGCRAIHDAGLRLFVTDHHQEVASDSVRDFAEVVVDPCALDETYRLREICGAHVMWQVVMEYARTYCTADVCERIWRLRAFAGIGTVSDIMLLEHQNRQLVRDAVSMCRVAYSGGDNWFIKILDGCETYRRAMNGLFEICDCFARHKVLTSVERIDESFFGFYVAPTFNSCKRLDAPMSLAFDVFFGDKPDDAMEQLFFLNEKRKQLIEQTLAVVRDSHCPYEPFAYVLQNAHGGVLGPVAQKQSEVSGLPCVVLNYNPDKGTFGGSGRSPDWYPFQSRVTAAGFWVRGHEGAFGIRFSSKDELDAFYKFIVEDVREVLAEIAEAGGEEQHEEKFDFTIDTRGNGDIALDLDEFMLFCDELQAYRPFGRGFEEPKIALRFDAGEAQVKRIGRSNPVHFKFVLPYGFSVMCFHQAQLLDDHDVIGPQLVVGTLDINEWMGKRSPQFRGKWRVD